MSIVQPLMTRWLCETDCPDFVGPGRDEEVVGRFRAMEELVTGGTVLRMAPAGKSGKHEDSQSICG